MKKLLIYLVGTVLLLWVAGYAGDPSPSFPPPGGSPHDVYQLDEETGEWINIGQGVPDANAQAFSSDPELGTCNKESWLINFEHHVSMAQWVEWTISGTRLDWFVRKPGCYAANSVTLTLKSNYDVAIDYDGFEDLQYQDLGGVTLTIPAWYAVTTTQNPPPFPGLDWVAALDLNAVDPYIYDSEDLHSGLSFKLWYLICVVESNSASEYEDDATVTIVLQKIKKWIDPLTGNYQEFGG